MSFNSLTFMDLGKEQFWVIEPNVSLSEMFSLHLLQPSMHLEQGKDNFVIVPYANPKDQKISTQFFRLKSSQSIKITNKEIHNKLVFRNNISKQNYIQHLNFLKNQIQLGTIYEVNYCTQFRARADDFDFLSVFNRLKQLSKVPYNYLVKLNHDYILCCSPETFLERRDCKLITKPIKGTIRRGANDIEDLDLKKILTNSLKDKTEHVMAVDVARNDLSMIAERGSVNVENLYGIESFKTVHQMVSKVNCDLKSDVSFDTIIQASFPMASMTGAPKQSAMNLIGETEQFERNFYSGTLGFIQANGNFDLPVVIRTLFYNEITKELTFSVGGAITYLSKPEEELEECLLKAQTMIKAVNADLEWD